jgi:hypothetical protein
VNGVEQERLKQALDRLIDAQREALDVIAEGLEPDVGGLGKMSNCWPVSAWKRPWRRSGPSWKELRKT